MGTFCFSAAAKSHTYTKSDWTMFTAACVTENTLRDNMISSVRKRASSGLGNQPLSDWYDTVTGQGEGFYARPVVGGHFALVSCCDYPNAVVSRCAF